MNRILLALLLMSASLSAMADTTAIQSFPGGLTNFQAYKSTDVLPTPSGWSLPANGSTQPMPPSTVSITSGWIGIQAGIYSTPDAACNANHAGAFAGNCLNTGTINGVSGQCSGYQCIDSRGGGWSTAGWYFGCSVGYTLTGSYPNQTCNLSAPTQVTKPSDGICTLVHNADGTYAYDNGGGTNGGDPDCTAPWQDAVAAVNDKTRGDACSCDSATPSTPSIPEPANSN